MPLNVTVIFSRCHKKGWDFSIVKYTNQATEAWLTVYSGQSIIILYKYLHLWIRPHSVGEIKYRAAEEPLGFYPSQSIFYPLDIIQQMPPEKAGSKYSPGSEGHSPLRASRSPTTTPGDTDQSVLGLITWLSLCRGRAPFERLWPGHGTHRICGRLL